MSQNGFFVTGVNCFEESIWFWFVCKWALPWIYLLTNAMDRKDIIVGKEEWDGTLEKNLDHSK